jgi:hypothetical protein
LKGTQLPVSELGPNSFFVAGPEAVACVKGGQYRLKLHYNARAVVCTTECVRTETAPRVGAVFRLLSDERGAMAMLQEVLRPPK